MTKHFFIKLAKAMMLLIPSIFFAHSSIAQQNKPNFVWIVAEDIGKQFQGIYEPTHGANVYGAQMPALDTLAAGGIKFNNAHKNAITMALLIPTMRRIMV